MTWTDVQSFLIGEWAGLLDPRWRTAINFAASLAAAGIAIWLIQSARYAVLIRSLKARLAVSEARQQEFDRAFGDRAPAVVAGRLRQLERLAETLPPRRLGKEQRAEIAAMGRPADGSTYLAIVHDSASPEAVRYARDFRDALSQAIGWNVIDEAYPMTDAPVTGGLSVGLTDPALPSATELLVITALQRAQLEFGIAARSTHGADVEIIVRPR